MDSERFDGLVRSFGYSPTRRQVVRWLGSMGLAAASVIGVTVATDTTPDNDNGHACCGQE